MCRNARNTEIGSRNNISKSPCLRDKRLLMYKRKKKNLPRKSELINDIESYIIIF